MDNVGYMDSDNGSLDGLPVSKGTYYELKNLQERHKELLRLLVLGVQKKEICAILGITHPMIQYVCMLQSKKIPNPGSVITQRFI